MCCFQQSRRPSVLPPWVNDRTCVYVCRPASNKFNKIDIFASRNYSQNHVWKQHTCFKRLSRGANSAAMLPSSNESAPAFCTWSSLIAGDIHTGICMMVSETCLVSRTHVCRCFAGTMTKGSIYVCLPSLSRRCLLSSRLLQTFCYFCCFVFYSFSPSSKYPGWNFNKRWHILVKMREMGSSYLSRFGHDDATSLTSTAQKLLASKSLVGYEYLCTVLVWAGSRNSKPMKSSKLHPVGDG